MRYLTCVACVGLFANAALAGDHAPYEPVVSIEEEPNHHLVLSGDSLRVFDVSFPPGKTSLWHMHDKNSVLVCLDGADVPSEEPGKALVARPPIASGYIYYREYARNPFVHRISNRSANSFRILDIEVLKHGASPTRLPSLNNAFVGIVENDVVRVAKVTMKGGETIDSLRFHGPHLLIAMTNGKLRIELPGQCGRYMDVKRGDLHFEEMGRTKSIGNAGEEDLEMVLVEVK